MTVPDRYLPGPGGRLSAVLVILAVVGYQMGGHKQIGSKPSPRGPQAGVVAAFQHGGLAAALMQSLQHHPGGVAGLLDSMHRNGLSDQITRWASGDETPATPDQIAEGLRGTGLVEDAAARAGVSPAVSAAAIAGTLPILIRQLAPAGYVPQSRPYPMDHFSSRML